MTSALRVTYTRISARRDVAMPSLRIAMLADLHACTGNVPLSKVRAIVDQTNALGADMICLMGDYPGHNIGSRPLTPEEVLPELQRLHAPLGVWSIFGNHEWRDDKAATKARASETKWHRAFRAAGMRCLVNEVTQIDTAHAPLTLAGLDSQRAFKLSQTRYEGAHDWQTVADHLDPARFTLLLAHEPDIFPALPDHVDLTLSGHNHGGQVNPFGRPLLVPSKFGRRYAYGHVTEGTRQIVISGGIGTSGLPLRMNMPPELNLVELR